MAIRSLADISPMRRLRRRRELERSLTLLRVFLLASAVICAAGGIALGWMLSHSLTAEALDAEQTALARYVDGVVGPTLVRGDKVVVSPRDRGRFTSSVRRRKDIFSVKVWRADGVLAWTNVDPKRIGRQFPLEDELGEVIKENSAIADLVGTGGNAKDEDAFERNELARAHHVHQLFEVYAPIESTDGSHAIGATRSTPTRRRSID
jgi:hypothetical protein